MSEQDREKVIRRQEKETQSSQPKKGKEGRGK